MVTVATIEQFEVLNGKVDQILAAVEDQGRMIQGNRAEFREFRAAVNQRFEEVNQKLDGLTSKVDGLTQAHGELRRAFDEGRR